MLARTLRSLLLVLALTAPVQAAGGPETFHVPSLHAGDRVAYEGAFDYALAVREGVAMPLMDGTTATLPAAETASRAFGLHDMLQAWDPASGGILAERFSCPARGDGECLPHARESWRTVGFPAMLGVAALQGATLAVGDAWTLPRACASCAPPTRFLVEAPAPDAPAGTAFSVRVEPGDEAWRLDMPAGSPYPLRVGLGALHADLVLLERGDAPLAAAAAPPMTFASRPGARPYVDGIPVEGTPFPGWPAWSEARNATGSPPLPTPESLLTSVTLSRRDTTLRLGPVPVNESREWRIVVDAAAPGETRNARATYARTHPYPDVLGPAGHAPAWTRTQTSVAGPVPEACAHASIPLWDLARLAAAYAGRQDVSGWAFDNGACGEETLTLSLPSPGAFQDKTVVAAGTGLLKERFVWTG